MVPRCRSWVWKWEVDSCDYILIISLTFVMVIIEAYLGRSILNLTLAARLYGLQGGTYAFAPIRISHLRAHYAGNTRRTLGRISTEVLGLPRQQPTQRSDDHDDV
jgi:hypothetical protein